MRWCLVSIVRVSRCRVECCCCELSALKSKDMQPVQLHFSHSHLRPLTLNARSSTSDPSKVALAVKRSRSAADGAATRRPRSK